MDAFVEERKQFLALELRNTTHVYWVWLKLPQVDPPVSVVLGGPHLPH